MPFKGNDHSSKKKAKKRLSGAKAYAYTAEEYAQKVIHLKPGAKIKKRAR